MDEQKRNELLTVIAECTRSGFCLKNIHQCDLRVVDKFVKNHKLPIEGWQALGYCDMALFGAGKKGMLLAENFFYYSDNGKPGVWVDFNGLVEVKTDYNRIIAFYADGRQLRANTPGMSDYCTQLLNRVVGILNSNPAPKQAPKPEPAPQPEPQPKPEPKSAPEPVFDQAQSDQLSRETQQLSDVLGAALQAKMEELERMERGEAAPEPEPAPAVDAAQAALEEQQRKLAQTQAALAAQQAELLRLQQELEAQQKAQEEARAKLAAELKAKAEAEAKSQAEARARAEAEARARAEAEARAKAEAEAKMRAAERAKAEAEARASAQAHDRARQAVADDKEAAVEAQIKMVKEMCLDEASEIARKAREMDEEEIRELLERWTAEGYGTKSLLNLFLGTDLTDMVGLGFRDELLYDRKDVNGYTRYVLKPEMEPDNLYETLIPIVAEHMRCTPMEVVTDPNRKLTEMAARNLVIDVLPAGGYVSGLDKALTRLTGREVMDILMQIILPPHASMCRVLADMKRRVKAVTDPDMAAKLIREAQKAEREAAQWDAIRFAREGSKVYPSEIRTALQNWQKDGYGTYCVSDLCAPGEDPVELMGQGFLENYNVDMEFDDGVEQVHCTKLSREEWNILVADQFGFESPNKMYFSMVGDRLPELLGKFEEIFAAKPKKMPQFPQEVAEDLTVGDLSDIMAQLILPPAASLCEVLTDVEGRVKQAGLEAELRFNPMKQQCAEQPAPAKVEIPELDDAQIGLLVNRWHANHYGRLSVRTYWPGEEREHMGIGFATEQTFTWKGQQVPNSELTAQMLRDLMIPVIAGYLQEDPEAIVSPDCDYALDEIDAVEILELVENELETNELPMIDDFNGYPMELMDVLCQVILPPHVSMAAVITEMDAQKKAEIIQKQRQEEAEKKSLLNRKAFAEDLSQTYWERLQDQNIPDRDEPVLNRFRTQIPADELPDEIIGYVIERADEELDFEVCCSEYDIRQSLEFLVKNNRALNIYSDFADEYILGTLFRMACCYRPPRNKNWEAHAAELRRESDRLLRQRYCKATGCPSLAQMQPLYDCSTAAVAVLGAPGVGKSTLLDVLSKKHNTWGGEKDHRHRIELDQSVLEIGDYEIENDAIALVEPRLREGFEGEKDQDVQLLKELQACRFRGFILVMDADMAVNKEEAWELSWLLGVMDQLQVPCLGILVNKTDLTEPRSEDVYFTWVHDELKPCYGGWFDVRFCSLKEEAEKAELSDELRYFTQTIWEETCHDHKWMWWRD